ncbi:MAG: MATE family efflux transporter [Planctomycetota bacterium]
MPTDRPRRASHAGRLARLSAALDWRNAVGIVDILRQPADDARGLDEQGRLRSGRLKGLSMAAAIWVLSWPILVESALNALVGLTDTLLTSEMDSVEGAASAVQAVDAISAASFIMWFIGLAIMALGTGATAIISRSIGKGRTGVANAALGQCLLLCVIIGALVGGIVALSTLFLPDLMGLEGEGAEAFRAYMLIIAAFVPTAGILFGGIACARGAGDSVRPLWAMIARNIVNIIASWALSGVDISIAATATDGEIMRTVLLENPFGFDMGIVGIALGTVLGDCVGAAIILWMAFSGTWGIRLKLRRLRPHWHTARRLIRLGLPNYAETMGMWAGNFMVVFMVGHIAIRDAAGEVLSNAGTLGSHMWAIRIEALSFLPGFSMGIAAATLAGQYLGAGSPRHAIRAVIICAAIASTIMGLIGVALILFPHEITRALTPVPEHLRQVPPLLYVCGFIQVPFALAIVFRQALRGVGDVRVVMGLTWFTTYGVRLPAAYLVSGVRIPLPDGTELPNPLGELMGWDPSLTRMWIAMCGELIIRGIVFTVRFGQGTWTKLEV